MDEITVLKVAPLCEPEVVTLKNNLRALQEAISIHAPYVGLIEIIPVDAQNCILCNEEGKLLGLPLNRALFDKGGEMFDIICGTFLVTGLGAEDLTSLPPDLLEKYYRHFQAIEYFF